MTAVPGTLGRVAAEPHPWPPGGEVVVARTALLCVDWQGEFCLPDGYLAAMGYGTAAIRACLAPTAAVLAAARRAGMRVAYTREGYRTDLGDCAPHKLWRSARAGARIGALSGRGRTLVRGQPGWQVVPELAPEPGDWVIDKPGKGAFYASDLELVLRANGISHLVVTGALADVSVGSAVREAADRGFECLLLSDCTGATSYGTYVGALEMVTAHGGLFGAVGTSAAFIAALGG